VSRVAAGSAQDVARRAGALPAGTVAEDRKRCILQNLTKGWSIAMLV